MLSSSISAPRCPVRHPTGPVRTKMPPSQLCGTHLLAGVRFGVTTGYKRNKLPAGYVMILEWGLMETTDGSSASMPPALVTIMLIT